MVVCCDTHHCREAPRQFALPHDPPKKKQRFIVVSMFFDQAKNIIRQVRLGYSGDCVIVAAGPAILVGRNAPNKIM